MKPSPVGPATVMARKPSPPKRIAHFKKTEVTLKLYGKEQVVRYRSKILKARFLNGRLVRVVWCEFKSESGNWKSTCLLLSTDTELTPEEVIESYGLRWSIESMFNQLKHGNRQGRRYIVGFILR